MAEDENNRPLRGKLILDNVHIYENLEDGVRSHGNIDIEIKDSRIDYNGRDGVSISDGGTLSAVGGSISNNGRRGVNFCPADIEQIEQAIAAQPRETQSYWKALLTDFLVGSSAGMSVEGFKALLGIR